MLLPVIGAAVLAQTLILSAGVAPRAEQFRYRFEHPSTFDTPALVPHFFEQRYDVIPLWFSAEARYAIGGRRASTRASFSLKRQTRGSDIDTFLQPSGDIVTSGTDGDVDLQSFAVSQYLPLATVRGWLVDSGLHYRHDRAEFAPDDRIVTHTQPASVTRTFITDRETTVSRVIAVGVGASRERRLQAGWLVRMRAEIQPLVQGRLLIQLPDKYPGVDLVYNAVSVGGDARWDVERQLRHWHVRLSINVSGARGYRRSSSYSVRSASVSVLAGWQR